MADGPLITHLLYADDYVNGWDSDIGQPGANMFANAVQVWCTAQNRLGITVADAALAFNVRPDLIREAVDWHEWMFIGRGDTIEHEGE